MKNRRWILVLIPLLLSCSTDNPVTVVNQPPTISFATTRLAFQKLVSSTLRVSVSDPEGDPLTVSWSITRGILTPTNTQKTQMTWQVPDLGVDTLVVTVSDGEFTQQITEVLHVATLRDNPQLDGTVVAALSPYIVRATGGIVTVQTTSQIEAGVVLFIDAPGLSIQVEGTMNCQGTVANPITIRPNDRTLRCQSGGWWEGIEVRGTGLLTMTYADIWYGDKNVSLLDSGKARMTNCALRCAITGARVATNAWFSAYDCDFDNNQSTGISIESLTATPDSVSIKRCRISINGNTGILMDLRDNTQTVPISVMFNSITSNFTHGVSLDNAVFPLMRQNHFDGNGLSGGTSNLHLKNDYPGAVSLDTLDCRENYWGAVFADPSGPLTTIRDKRDDANVGSYVNVTPWLNTTPVP